MKLKREFSTVNNKPIRVSMLSLHGLIRGRHPELGRDADTGGQIKYVLELMEELGQRSEVSSVELITRQVLDPKISGEYAQIEEVLSEKTKIVRLPFGPRRYLRKEALWPYLDHFVDQCLMHFRRHGIPDLLHAHYADAGYAGAQLARLLSIPFVFTGHSLGRVKRERLLAARSESADIEKTYRFSVRNEAEEVALETASLVITSTSQEIRDQYEKYEHYQPERMEVIPPGVALDRFFPPQSEPDTASLQTLLRPFLREPNKPAIIAIARPDHRKNLETLVRVYGESKELQQRANLVLCMGHREDLRELTPALRKVLLGIITLIDVYDLYGKVAYPKSHTTDDVPKLYRWAASGKGVFINAALTEPFGLTLIEAAASGLPIVATRDGGPVDIVANCNNGLLVDPLDEAEIEHALLRVLTEEEHWKSWSQNGIRLVRENYTWTKHVDRYLRDVLDLLQRNQEQPASERREPARLPEFDRMVVTDLDNTLDGDDGALAKFVQMLENSARHVGFGIATGRRIDSVMQWIKEHDLPQPDVISAAVGTELYYGKSLQPDVAWKKHIRAFWQPEEVKRVLESIPQLTLQDEHEQTEFKVSYRLDTRGKIGASQIRRILREAGLRAKVIFSLGMFLDVIPIRAGDGLAIRFLVERWGFAPEQLLIAGDSGNDEEMLRGRTLGVVVGNYSSELEKLREFPRIYFAQGHHAQGILEGIDYYNFLGNIRIPNDVSERE